MGHPVAPAAHYGGADRSAISSAAQQKELLLLLLLLEGERTHGRRGAKGESKQSPARRRRGWAETGAAVVADHDDEDARSLKEALEVLREAGKPRGDDKR
ncbi:hypothetical protein AAVH_11821 [Aphelenchoides avenae]|nr:hypothetical protein AAVH_30347 [Aphelenchus avenae]KAH7720768.1 hypothetical protein AAVH_11821 [Aphelenchus avenae]